MKYGKRKTPHYLTDTVYSPIKRHVLWSKGILSLERISAHIRIFLRTLGILDKNQILIPANGDFQISLLEPEDFIIVW